MADLLSAHYAGLLTGSYDCVDRIVLNGHFRMASSAGGFREWWQRLHGSPENLDNAHLMRMAGRFSRRVRAYAKAKGIPVIDCAVKERKHEIAEEYQRTTKVTHGLFLVLVGRAQAPVWDVSGKHHLERKKPRPFVNHYSFHILDADWGHITIKLCGHPPFAAQIMLNGHEYVACQARKQRIAFTKEGNCFTHISDAAGLAQVADTLSEEATIGRLSQVCERWIYTTCLCFALESGEQERSGFRYQYSVYQMEYSRNLIFEIGGQMEQVFQALIDRSRAPLDLDTIKTILGMKRRPRYRPRKGSGEWVVAVEKPTYDLTIFKLQCGKLTLKIYTKGERVLRLEAMVHNTEALACGRSLERFAQIVARLREILERFMLALSGIDACFIADDVLEELPARSQVGRTTVGGIDFNKPRMRQVTEALLALSWSPGGFTAGELARKVRSHTGQGESDYGPRQAAYDLKKLRGKQFVDRVGKSRRYKANADGLRALTALTVLWDKVIKPLLAAALRPSLQQQPSLPPTTIDVHYQTLRTGMHGLFRELGVAA